MERAGNWVNLGFDIQNAIVSVFGIIVIDSAIMLYRKPQRHVLCGILIIVFSVFSVFSIFSIVLGLVGGILAIKWKHEDNPMVV